MSDDLKEMFLTSIKDVKEDVRQLDKKFDCMHELLVKNTVVLEAHEARSTASEKRIGELEDKEQARADEINKVKGFFIYTGIILSVLGSLGAVVHFWIQPFIHFGK